VRALPRDAGTLAAIRAAGVAADAAPLVRLWLLDALGECPASPEATALVLEILADPRTGADPALADAATSAAAGQAAAVLPALISVLLQAPPETPRLADDTSPARLALVERVAEHVARGGDGPAVSGLVGRLATAKPETAAAALTGLARGWPNGRRIEFDAAGREALVTLVGSLPTAAQGQLITLVQRAGSDALDAQIEGVTSALLATIDKADAADRDRGDDCAAGRRSRRSDARDGRRRVPCPAAAHDADARQGRAEPGADSGVVGGVAPPGGGALP
jgi:hypothetical protein